MSDNATITIASGGLVKNTAVSNNGLYSTGANTIDFRNNSRLTIQAGGLLYAAGTQGSAEAVNPEGSGNVIDNYGTIRADSAAAIWFQNTSGTNTVINEVGGVIQGPSLTANVMGASGNGAVNFTNMGAVKGSLLFAGGNDTLNLVTGSTVSGSINGGGGSNALILSGTGTDTLPTITNFQTLTKQDSGIWTITNPLNSISGSSPLTAEVQAGTLVLSGAAGNNTSFTGTMLVDQGGILQASSQNLPPVITDNGQVQFTQTTNGTYSGLISGAGSVMKLDSGTLVLAPSAAGGNTYSGGTYINQGAVAVGSDAALGAATGPITFNGGTLQFLSSFNLSSSRAITLNAANNGFAGGGTIDTNGVQTTVAQGMAGAGGLTVADSSGTGTGKLTLTGANTYAGGTTIAAGTLQLGNGGTSGSIVGNVTNNGILTFNRSDTVTFPGTISGAGAVNQIGAGTTVLTGANTYTGGTTIAAGTLQLGNGGTSGSIVGGVTNNSALTFDRSDTLTFPGTISGTGAVNQIGTGTMVLAGANTYTGATTVSAGTLQAGTSGAFSPGSNFTVDSGGTLDANGINQTAAGLTNAGLVATNLRGNSVGTTLTVAGNYVGQGGTLRLNTYLGTDGSPSDKLVLKGGAASGTTYLDVRNVNGPGALTFANGIQVVQALNGATTTATAFALARPALSGAYQYKLFFGGVGADANNQSWYLRDQMPVTPPGTSPTASSTPEPTVPMYRSEVPVYLADPEVANQLGFAMVNNLDVRTLVDYRAVAAVPAAPVQTTWCEDPKKRVRYRCVVPGDKVAHYTDARNKEIADYQTHGMWGRIFGEYGTQKPSGNYGLSTNNAFLNGKGPQYDYGMGGIQVGFDVLHKDNSDGSRDRAGVYLGYGLAHADVKNIYDSGDAGKIDLSGESLGAYSTHYGQAGWYVDNILQGTYFDRIHASGSNSGMTTDGWSGIASIETGYPIKVGSNDWTIEPQVQAIYQHVDLGSGTDAYGHTSFGRTDDVRGRIGARLTHPLAFADGRLATIWMRVNVWHDFMINKPQATFSSLNGLNPVLLNGTLGGTWGEVEAGASTQLTKTVAFFGSAFYDHSIDNGRSYAIGGRAGLKWTW
ncbi:autotransporter family protein [Methylovirgula sp. 4M-Z18]|uniref:autotransporter family protein n=1 Tax=Methylovirgula sp. 4M-Z18 TaxID=2293567 RepID=UPI0013147E86|nr:autotransporter outer membrane beta-barrel domain-containing protein [Methylovirgula sp. 4M-Z18]